MANFTIYKTNSKEPELKKLIKTFTPMSSGGYNLREYEEDHNIFIFTGLNPTQVKKCFVLVKKNELWLDLVSNSVLMVSIIRMLTKNGINFKTRYKLNNKVIL